MTQKSIANIIMFNKNLVIACLGVHPPVCVCVLCVISESETLIDLELSLIDFWTLFEFSLSLPWA